METSFGNGGNGGNDGSGWRAGRGAAPETRTPVRKREQVAKGSRRRAEKSEKAAGGGQMRGNKASVRSLATPAGD
ncbi:hypothetical protein Ssi03_05370 [Sphaerisporangium siamense]|nr:hypothetical protein Ssi03_05370 [Sphaerisporangium siamense]